VRLYTYMHKIASAGNGFYFDDIPTDTIEAPYLPGADFIIGVNGDSMEPTYKDGDLVYVEKRQIIETGEIGVFILNNECFIKEAGEDGLISHNKKYGVIPGSENIQCVGKVLGKVEMN
ncbi:MAG: S24 family peptidase, partial [Eubacteriales bacterium]|nr:S24 family peptidase [Eubacteriales bacterium]